MGLSTMWFGGRVTLIPLNGFVGADTASPKRHRWRPSQLAGVAVCPYWRKAIGALCLGTSPVPGWLPTKEIANKYKENKEHMLFEHCAFAKFRRWVKDSAKFHACRRSLNTRKQKSTFDRKSYNAYCCLLICPPTNIQQNCLNASPYII